MSSKITFRLADSQDQAFLTEMLLEAVNWSEVRLSREEVEADPQLARYVEGWPRRGDIGVIAVADERPAGAAWLRFLNAADPGYGYVTDDIPELSMAVVASYRRRGIGRAVFRKIATQAQSRGIEAISLSVEDGNPAELLYTSEGYQRHRRDSTSITLVKTLTPHRSPFHEQ